jgi:outer membrane protein OmpA-like peptidoglycan-associated protein
MHSFSCFRGLLVAALTSLGVLAGASPAFATHEQGGSIHAKITANGHLVGAVKYITSGSCVVGTATGQYPISVKSPAGTTNALNTDTATYTTCRPGSTTQTAPFDIDLDSAFNGVAPDGVYQVTFSSCCRISGSRNITSTATSFAAQVRRITGRQTHTPVINSNVSTGIAVGYEYNQNLNASDPDGGTLTYQSRAGQPDGPNTDIVTYSAAGDVRIPASLTATFSNNWTFVYKVRVVDSQGDYAERDILLRTTTNNKPPVINGLDGPIAAEPGRTTTVNFTALDPNNAAPKADTVALMTSTLPSWMTFTSTPGNPASGTLTISPPADAPNQTVGVNVDAFDNDAIAALLTSANARIVVGTPPTTTLTTQPPARTADNTPAFEFSSDQAGATFQCRVDTGSWTDCASPFTTGTLGDGEHTFQVRSSYDGMTDATPAEGTFTVDTTAPPAPEFTAGQDVTLTTRSAAFTFTGELGGAFECRLDGGAWGACVSPASFENLTDGNHIVEVRQTDAVGNVGDAAALPFEVDATAPDAPTVVTRPADVTSRPALAFTGEGVITCRIDGGEWKTCASPVTLDTLSDGPHVVELRATDQAGNSSDVTAVRFTVDTTAPAEPAVTEGPSGVTQSDTATFTFGGEPGGSYDCRLDDGAWAPCVGQISYPTLADGRHTFRVRQIDAAGNAGAIRTIEFTVSKAAEAAPAGTDRGPAGADRPVVTDERPSSKVTPEVAANAAVKQNNQIAVGCRLDHGSIKSCTVKAYVTIRGRNGRSQRVLIGVGQAGVGETGKSSQEVPVKLNKRGKQLLAESLGGLKVQFNTAAASYDTGKVLTATARAKVFPPETIVVPNDGLFRSDSATLTADGAGFIRQIRGRLRNVETITCVGHTDSVGGSEYNRSLGQRRAETVCRALESRGVRVSASSAGETAPRASNATRHGRALNRRVELTVTFKTA